MMTTRFLRRRLRAGPIALICLAGSLCCNDAAAQKSDDPNPQDKGESAMTTAEKAKTHKFTNRLIHTTSPYLLQHAHNPVDWYPWGPEALERARKENKPIFLSIGYSACHWCHVMERECFENEDIAAVMNTHFVCIKVDREERPDLDDIYMAATQALTRSGGWPMSVWLTPDQRPFYAGTYFPPDDRYGPQKNFKTLLIGLAEAWKNQHDQMDQQADRLTEAVKQMTRFEPGHEDVPYEVITRTAGFLAGRFDSIKGGMSGGRNKFPPSMAMDLMLRAYHASLADGKTPDTRLLELVELTLQKMAFGGIYDHLGGGFARYSTDPDWLAPHFEKMLYDQALISDIYLKAYQVTGKPLYARIAREIFDYVMTDLQGPGGGFYSTRDADSEGEEGRFYVWSRSEIVSILGPEEAEAFCEYYDVTEKGNWESHNILNVKRPNDQTHRRLEAARKKLFDVREKRIRPHLDDKILAAWNGLMIASMARGHRILGEPRYGEAAARAAEFVTTKMRDEQGRLMRTYRNGQTHTPGYLDDYAFMIDALLTLYEATFETRWLDQAERLNARLMANYLDKE
ncbi:MAG: thioredoxin domain-containing protein, partial [Phycisphaerae bacterium]